MEDRKNTPAWKQHGLLLLILSVSWCLRVVLVLRGGQGFLSDEGRYLRAWKLLGFLRDADWGRALDSLSRGAAHNGYTLVSLPAAAVQCLAMRFLGIPESVDSILNTAWVPALLLSPASVASVWLTYAVGRRAGCDKTEGLTAAFLMSCATSMLYYSRHLVSYDIAMALALAALWLALDSRPHFKSAVLCGVVAALAFLTYNGYWTLVLAVLAIGVLVPAGGAWEVVHRALGVGVGFVALPLLLTAASAGRDVEPYLSRLARFSRTITHGDFAEGWRLPWEYLWHAEHGLLLVWAIGTASVLVLCLRHGPRAHSRALLWLGAAGFVYVLLALFSSGLERFAVYGRLARQGVPFLCLTTAYGLIDLVRRRGVSRRVVLIGLSCLALQAGINFTKPFLQRFPRDVWAEVVSMYGPVDLGTTIIGRVEGGAPETRTSRYVLLNVQRVAPIEGIGAPPAGRVLLRVAHPLQYLPYQYDSGGPDTRSILRSADISMRLIDTQPPERDEGSQAGSE